MRRLSSITGFAVAALAFAFVVGLHATGGTVQAQDRPELGVPELLEAMGLFVENLERAERSDPARMKRVIQRQARYLSEYAAVLASRTVEGGTEAERHQFQELARKVQSDARALSNAAAEGQLTKAQSEELSASWKQLKGFADKLELGG
jgi:hypothetical protein